MSTIQNIFMQAELAEAAYANFFDQAGKLLSVAGDIRGALEAEGMPKPQAEAFLERWNLISQYSATDGGFSATLFQSKATGEYTFAIRGTLETTPDLLGADLDLIMDGLPMDQIVDMYNYFQSLRYVGQYQAAVLEIDQVETDWMQPLWRAKVAGTISSSDQLAYNEKLQSLQASGAIIDISQSGLLVRRIRFGGSSTLLSGTALAQGSGVLGRTPSNLNVTGHSLGGNLAAAFTRLFPSVNANAITINGAGFPTGNIAGGSGNAAGNIQNLFEKLGGAAGFDSSRIQNIVGDGAKMVSMDSQYGLVQPGKPQLEIFLEEHLGNTAGHSITQMVDSLALYDLFARLDPVLNASAAQANLDKITGILKAASSEANHLADLYATQAHLGKRFTSSRSTACSV